MSSRKSHNHLLSFSGEKGTLEYRIYLTSTLDSTPNNNMTNGSSVTESDIIQSFMHDIPLYPEIETGLSSVANIVNMIVEIPRFTTEKLEIKTNADKNPIMYDLKDGKIRNVCYHAKNAEKPGYPFHYGALPQTWENSFKIDHRTGRLGDDDPLDCFDISLISAYTGSIRRVKVLGAIAMIDDERTDWKIIGINTEDPRAELYDSMQQLPIDILNQIIDFLSFYKLPKITQFNKKMIWNVEDSVGIIRSLHEEWQEHKKPRSAT